MKKVSRTNYLAEINKIFRVHPICGILGPRQCGKTTLAKMFVNKIEINNLHYFDLEDPDHLNALQNPKLALESLTGIIIIDEIQRQPELFTYLRVFVDNNPEIKILILGSASPLLIKQSSETLAGRIGYLELMPFSLEEVNNEQQLHLRGGYPRAYLAETNEDSAVWRKNYIKTFLEQDIPNLGFRLNPTMLRRFWSMLCDYHGNIFNASELGRSLDTDNKSIKRYLDLLSGTFMIRQLQPWFVNISKRQVKSYKIYFRDSGIFHTLVGIDTKDELLKSSKLGASWEGFALEEIIRLHQAEPQDCFFWSLQSGAEVDLLIVKGTKKLAFEIKFTSRPSINKSMLTAIKELDLDYLTLVIPGDANYKLSDTVHVKGLNYLHS